MAIYKLQGVYSKIKKNIYMITCNFPTVAKFKVLHTLRLLASPSHNNNDIDVTSVMLSKKKENPMRVFVCDRMKKKRAKQRKFRKTNNNFSARVDILN